MQNVPKIVTERLKAAVPAQHPEAELLTAFAERSLSDRERMAVLEHLARCSGCREIVALAQPELESAVIVPAPVHRPWFAWPALRWGFAAAGLAILTTIGVVQYQHRTRTNETAARQNSDLRQRIQAQLVLPPASPSPAGQLANNAAVFPNTAQAKSAARSAMNKRAAAVPAAKASPAEKDRVVAEAESPAAQGHVRPSYNSIGGTIGGPLAQHQNAPLQWQQAPAGAQAFAPVSAVKQPNAASTMSPVPSSTETVEVQAANAQVTTETATTLPRTSGEADSEDESGLRRAKPVDAAVLADSAGKPQAASSNLGVDGRNFAQLVKMSPVAVPQWTINPAGGLARSFDQGATWQDVDVTAAAAMSRQVSFDSVAVLSGQGAAADKKKVKTEAPIFRAMSAMGMEVWAGGSGGVLYHSGDAGNHWTRILPVAHGVPLTGDVISLEFVDVQHGKITTSTGEIWITADDGESWQKQ
jgi:hypothetical protein